MAANQKCATTVAQFPRPPNNASLIVLIEHQHSPCSCDRCSFSGYVRCVHSGIHRYVQHWSLYLSVEAIGIIPALLDATVYEAIHLARLVERNISAREEDMSRMQKLAVERIRTEVHPGLSCRNAALTTSNEDMLRLLDSFDQLFFFGNWKARFKETCLLRPEVLGQCSSDGLIQMTPLSDGNDSADDKRRLRLGTLLHEATHAFFYKYACQCCATNPINVGNASGHGRAFMIVTTALEQACRRLFGEYFSVAGAEDWLVNWENVCCLPSVCDLKEWRWAEKELSTELERVARAGIDAEGLIRRQNSV